MCVRYRTRSTLAIEPIGETAWRAHATSPGLVRLELLSCIVRNIVNGYHMTVPSARLLVSNYRLFCVLSLLEILFVRTGFGPFGSAITLQLPGVQITNCITNCDSTNTAKINQNQTSRPGNSIKFRRRELSISICGESAALDQFYGRNHSRCWR